MSDLKDQTTFERLYKEYLKPMLVDVLIERLQYSRSWNLVGVTEDSSGIVILWSMPKVVDGAPFHKVVIPSTYKSVSTELGNQLLKLSRKQ